MPNRIAETATNGRGSERFTVGGTRWPSPLFMFPTGINHAGFERRGGSQVALVAANTGTTEDS